MSTVRCKNCGAVFDARLSSCPYCGTMNKKGAYAEFRMKVSSLIDSMLGLKDDVQRSVSRIILSSMLRGLVLITVIVGLSFAFSRTAKINYYNDEKYDRQAYDDIVWMEENLDALNEAYDSGDYKAVEKLYYGNTRAVQKWSRYSSYCLKYAFENIERDERFDAYLLQRMLHFIFRPEIFTGYNGMNRVDKDEYAEMRDALIAELENRGYSFGELEDIYEKCSNSSGYADYDLLKQYVKED
ncbi:MAG: zinc ribbon domain-containing protein [Firmicutes bacterium]|nr:zinc ribbon domain-containing protein [Bacillota bacterium]